jgi:hypothetical protein
MYSNLFYFVVYCYVYGSFIVKKSSIYGFSRLIYYLVHIHDYSLCMVVIMNDFNGFRRWIEILMFLEEKKLNKLD